MKYQWYKNFYLWMCGASVMNKKLKTKSSSQVIVVSIMCTVLVTIVWQSVNVALNPAQYESVQASSLQDEQSHGVAGPQQLLVTDELNAGVNKNKDKLNNRFKKVLWWVKGSNTSSEQLKTVENSQWTPWFDYHREEPHTHTEGENELQNQRDYVPFSTLQSNLKTTICKHEVPVDNADPPGNPAIQWWLDHCLITVSAAGKVYANDYLTHKMMRVIAERAWFVVKMEYATDQIVTNSQLLTFLNAVQQHHQISSIPSIPVGEKVTRGEYLTILYKLFTNDTVWDTLDVQETTSLEVLPLNSQTLSLGKEVIKAYEQNNLDIPNELKNQLLDYANKTLSDTINPTKDVSGEIGFDTQAVQATRVQVQEWLGRS